MICCSSSRWKTGRTISPNCAGPKTQGRACSGTRSTASPRPTEARSRRNSADNPICWKTVKRRPSVRRNHAASAPIRSFNSFKAVAATAPFSPARAMLVVSAFRVAIRRVCSRDSSNTTNSMPSPSSMSRKMTASAGRRELCGHHSKCNKSSPAASIHGPISLRARRKRRICQAAERATIRYEISNAKCNVVEPGHQIP